MSQTRVTPKNSFERAIVDWARSATPEEYLFFCNDLQTLAATGVISAIPFSNFSRLIEFGYFAANSGKAWAIYTLKFLEAIA